MVDGIISVQLQRRGLNFCGPSVCHVRQSLTSFQQRIRYPATPYPIIVPHVFLLFCFLKIILSSTPAYTPVHKNSPMNVDEIDF